MSGGFAFVVVAIILSLAGVNPIMAYGVMLKGAFGSLHGIADTLVKTTSLLLLGLAVAVAFKCKVWNLGTEGQLYIGALGATLIGISIIGSIPILGIIAMLAAGFVFGGCFALVPAALKVRFGISEIIVTVLLNFVVLLFIAYLLHGPLKDRNTVFNPYSPVIFSESQLPIILPHTRLHAGIIIAALAIIAVYILLSKTKIGFEIRSVGANNKGGPLCWYERDKEYFCDNGNKWRNRRDNRCGSCIWRPTSFDRRDFSGIRIYSRDNSIAW